MAPVVHERATWTNRSIARSVSGFLDSDLGPTLATIHPSAVLRATDEARDQAYRQLVDDLRVAAARLG
jgi:hypothetical protein